MTNISTITLGIIGCGRWGINHVKTANNLLGTNLRTVFDPNPSARKAVSDISPTINCVDRIDLLLNNTEINSVVIATPAETHFNVAKKCLENGKHVLVEKPITLNSKDAFQLTEYAKKNNLQLMVGHVLLYHPAIVMMKKYINEKKIGKLQYIYSNRLNLGALRNEENVLWSFAPHDISIMQYFNDTSPVSINSHGAYFVQPNIEDTTITYLTYPDNVHAHIFVSWLHPFKEHRLVVIGDKGMLVFEDSVQKDKLKFYPKGFSKTEKGYVKFDNDFISIPFDQLQPLTEEHKHFYECVLTGKKPLTDGNHAVEVLKILEQATRRLHHD